MRVTSTVSAGLLTLDGTPVTDGQLVLASAIATGRLSFAPAAQASGSNYASLGFQVQDDGGTANGGIDLDPTTRTLRFDVTPVNDAPSGADRTLTLAEDTTRVLTLADFGFSDSADAAANNFLAVRITTTVGAGLLTLDGTPVTDGQVVAASAIAAGRLSFAPAAQASGSNYASLGFQVQDDGGTANGGIDLDPITRTLRFDVTPVNDAPSGANLTLTLAEDTSRVLTLADFGFSDSADAAANNFLAVRITTTVGAGLLTLDGTPVADGQTVAASAIATGRLSFAPAAQASGSNYASLGFQVQDDGGTANGGIDLDPTTRTLRFDVTPVNDAPSGADRTLTLAEDTTRVLTLADFGFSDSADAAANNFLAVRITTTVGAGLLTLDGTPVADGQTVAASAIDAGRLSFAPAAQASGSNYASLGFQVQDDGGTANGGIDLDPTTRTLRFDVTPVNDAPSGANRTLTLAEDTTRVLTLADFGFNDSVDTAANNFLAVRVTTTVGAGLLTLDGTPVTDGQLVLASAIATGRLSFAPAAQASGSNYASLGFQVQDDGGTANGGLFGLARAWAFGLVNALLIFTVQVLRSERLAALAALREAERRHRIAVLRAARLEQLRIGQQMHDEVGQEATALSLLARSIERRLEQGLTVQPAEAQAIVEGAKRIDVATRNAVQRLLAVDSHNGSLTEALRALVERLERVGAPAIDLQLPETLPHLPRTSPRCCSGRRRRRSITRSSTPTPPGSASASPSGARVSSCGCTTTASGWPPRPPSKASACGRCGVEPNRSGAAFALAPTPGPER